MYENCLNRYVKVFHPSPPADPLTMKTDINVVEILICLKKLPSTCQLIVIVTLEAGGWFAVSATKTKFHTAMSRSFLLKGELCWKVVIEKLSAYVTLT